MREPKTKLEASERRNPAAERQRRYRARQRSGRRVVEVEIDGFDVLATLIDRRLLSEEEARDDAKVSRALSRIVSDWTARNRQ